MTEQRDALDIAQVVHDHLGAVYRYAYRLTGSVADAEDLTQHVFLIAQQRLDQVRRADRIRGWLFAILRNHFLKQQKSPVVAVQCELLECTEAAGKEKHSTQIDGEQLQEALNGLPPHHRIVLTMFYYEGYSYREIAEELRLPIGTVMSRLSRAKRCLKKQLFAEQTEHSVEASPAESGSGLRRG